MRAALMTYEHQHGTLPPLYLRDDLENPIHSWRALVLPILVVESSQQLDLSQPWHSDHNRAISDRIPLLEWTWFARDHPPEQFPVYTHILAFIGRNSIWDETTGVPKGTFADNPQAILLVSIPKSNIEPLEPGDITEDEVRKLVENGHEVLFIKAGPGATYGTVTIETGELAFHTWQEVLDQRDDTH
jgi:hypothetical protein